jgi:aminoglycoside phosphotransferase (APT) family kinase protein
VDREATPDPGPFWSGRLAALVARHRPGRRLLAIRRAPLASGPRRSVERITLALDGGRHLDVVFKDLGSTFRVGRPGAPMRDRATDPGREPWAYRTLLGPRLGAPGCLGVVSDRVRHRHWLFLEPVEGVALATRREPEAWRATARWLARFHVTMAERPVYGGPVLRHDPDLHRWWYRRAVARARARVRSEETAERTTAREALSALRGLAAIHREAALEALGHRPTIVHGDFDAGNVLVETGSPSRIRPLDWEMVGLGPRLLDLAALIESLPDGIAPEALVEAYRSAASDAGAVDPGDRRFTRELLVCRLLRAMERCGRGALEHAEAAARHAGELVRR